MASGDLASVDGDADCFGIDTKRMSRFLEIDPSLRLTPMTIVPRGVMSTAERDHSFSRPRIATAREEPISIHGAR
jgi:hypothetical protein